VARRAGQYGTQEAIVAGEVAGNDRSLSHRQRHVASATVDDLVLNALQTGPLEVEADDLE
jgi:hypothetical protein